MKIKILRTISMSLTEGEIYNVIKQNNWIDDEGDEMFIVNNDEAEYEYLTVM